MSIASCVTEPRCLARDPGSPSPPLCHAHAVGERIECEVARKSKELFIRFGAFCNRSVYRTSGGALATLPPLSVTQLEYMYAHVFERHLSRGDLANVAAHPKVVDAVRTQREWLLGHMGDDDGRTPLNVVEMGCLHGSLLASFHSLSAPRYLRCFEPSSRFHPQLSLRFQLLNNASAAVGGRAAAGHAEFTGGLFNGSALAPGSVDLFLSSHVLEHLADPCEWLEGVWRALRPGGYIFTEIPHDYVAAEEGRPPYFHLLFFDEGSFARMMQSQGFEQIAIELAPLVAVANATTGLRGSTQKHQGQSSTPLVVRSLFKKSQSSRMAWAPR